MAAAESTPEQKLELSRTAELWATSPEFELEDDLLRVALFISASEQAGEGGDAERALAMARQTVAVAEDLGDWLIPDVRIRLYECLATVGHEDEAADTNGPTEEFEFELLVVSRSEVRGKLGMPVDEYDTMARYFEEAWDEENGF